jgi:hypothetical protein
MGGNDRDEWCMDGFHEAVAYCGFSDLGYRGLPYTWYNHREGAHNVKVRLDRGLTDDNYLEMFEASSVTHIQTADSDHCAIHVRVIRSGASHVQGGGKPFRYENLWQRHHQYQDTVAAAWNGGCMSLGDVNANLGHLQSTLLRWDREDFGSVKGELQKLRKRLESVHSQTIRDDPAPEER